MLARLLFVTVLGVCATPCATQNNTFRFANTHGDHMVLQAAPNAATVWGYGSPSQLVTVKTTAPGGIGVATVDETGIWLVILPPVKAGFQSYTVTATSGSETIQLNDVLYGDVWFCSGQSNMQFTVDQAFNASEEVADAINYPNIRVFTASQVTSGTPLNELANVQQNWSVASPTSIGGGNWTYFSAVCWFFGKETFKQRNYPIGLIASDWGGTRIEAWMDQTSLRACHTNVSIKPPQDKAVHTLKEGTVPDLKGDEDPSVLFNAMVFPFIRTTIYGAIWYQGESDCNGLTGANHTTSTNYACTFPTMIASWRTYWSLYSKSTNPLFPFGFMQLSTWGNTQNSTCGDRMTVPDQQSCDVAVVRYGQTANHGYVPNTRMPNTFMAVAMDLGSNSSWSDIHPRYKKEMSARLALSAQAVAYSNAAIPVTQTTGPLAITAINRPGLVTLSYINTGPSLVIKHDIGFEVSPMPCNLDFPNIDPSNWTSVGMLSHTQNTVTLSSPFLVTKCVRYNWYRATCMTNIEPYLCAIYGEGAFGLELPSPPFILPVA